MKEHFKFTEQLLDDSLKYLQRIDKTLHKHRLPSNPDILDDRDVMELFHISRTTLYKYRKEKLISYCRLGGRNIYFRQQLIRNLMKISQQQQI